MPEVSKQINCCSVRGKIKCVYQSKVVSSQQSNKRNDQMYKVVATEELSDNFATHIKEGDLYASEKFDGTCCLIDEFHGRPWIWARHDIKPLKPVDKRFKAYQQTKNQLLLTDGAIDEKYPAFAWDLENDFKEAPDDWVAASGAEREAVVPDDIGHMVGWVPVDPSLRQHLWHLSAVNLNEGLALFLNDSNPTDEPMKISACRLSEFSGKTFELIGTHVNGNPYGLGCKKNPIHVLVQHGEFKIKTFPHFDNGLTHSDLKEWFDGNTDGHCEGIVWHSENGDMFKLHRHHLDLKWPIGDLRLSSRAVSIDMSSYEGTGYCKSLALFNRLKTIDGRTFSSISELSSENFEES